MDYPETTQALRDKVARDMAREAAGTATLREMERDRAMKPGQVLSGGNKENDRRGKPAITLVVSNDHAVSTMPTSQKRTNRLSLVCMGGVRL